MITMGQEATTEDRRRALYAVCLGMLMILLDTTIVAVALPSIMVDLSFSGSSLTWMLNIYTLPFGGFLMLSGRLGDLYGARRVFLSGLVVFTLASVACGISTGQALLLIARAMQGLGSAMVTAVSLSLITEMFPQADERARAMGIYGFVCAAGGAVGVLLGGVLVKALSWHWIFLVNLPIGLAVYALGTLHIPQDRPSSESRPLDIPGAVAMTSSLTMLVYALVYAGQIGWNSMEIRGLLAGALVLLFLFIYIEMSTRQPLIPLRLFSLRSLVMANLIGLLWAAGEAAWFVIGALYLQRVLGYDPLRVGLSFLPATAVIAAFSAGLTAKVVLRFGIPRPLCAGFLLMTVGLSLFARAPIAANYVIDVLPGMMLLALGSGIVSTPMMLAAMNDVDTGESGLASGLFNTFFMFGSVVGLAVLASLGATSNHDLISSSVETLAAINGGYHIAFLAGALFTGIAAVGSALAPLRTRAAPAHTNPSPSTSS